MANTISDELRAQFFSQNSSDPFLTLVTLQHSSFDNGEVKLVNNTADIISRGYTYKAFPMRVRLSVDDGETARTFALDVDNVSLELITLIRGVTTAIGVKLEMILASLPDVVQMSQEDLIIQNITYNAQRISAVLMMDNFLTVGMTSERYLPGNFPGLFS